MSTISTQLANGHKRQWPIRLKPLDDELTSSWIVRIALAFGLSAQTFAHLVLRRNIWKSDFDITSHEIVLEIIATQTNTPLQRSYQTTLGAYEGHLFTSLSINGVHKWFLTRNQYPHFRHKVFEPSIASINSCTKGYGLQFCPRCLSNDKEPYFRRTWRLAFAVICTKHRTLLMSECSSCGASVNFHLTPRNLYELKRKFSITQCFNCFSDLRDSTVERPQVPIEAEEIEFQDYLLDGLRGGSIDLPQYGRVYSHLFFDGLYQILSRLVVGRGAKHLRPALKRYFNLRVFSVERFSQYLPIRRLGVAERRGLLEVGRLLLEEWPDRFVTFSKSHKVTVHTSISRDSETPYWLFRVIKDHLTSCKYVHVVTDQEIRSVIGYLKGKGIEPTYTNLCKYIHKNAVYAFLSKNNLVWQTVRQKCPCCRREAVQVRSRLNSDGRRLYKCQSCKRLHLYDTAPHKYPQDFREQAIKLCQAGNGTRKVAAMLSIFRGTVKRWWREHKNSI